MSWLEGPLAGFDLETTGVDIDTDRIVTACVGYAGKPGLWAPRNWMLACGDIPEGATAVHGITTEQAKRGGTDAKTGTAEIRDALYAAWASGGPVIGHNIAYDFSLLNANLIRLGLGPLEIAGPVLDSMVLDRQFDMYRKGKRTLEAACAHYGVPLIGAHGAEADALASVRLTWAIALRYDLGDHDLAILTTDQAKWHAERQASFTDYLTRQGKDASDVSTDWPMKGTK